MAAARASLSALSPPLTDGGSARRARRRGRSLPPGSPRCGPRLAAEAPRGGLVSLGGACAVWPSPSAPFPACRRGACAPGGGCPGGRRALLGSRPPCRPSPGLPLPRPSPSPRPGVAARLRCAGLAAPGRAWPSRWPFGPPRLLRAWGLAAGRRGRLARPRVGSAAPGAVKVKVKTKVRSRASRCSRLWGLAPPVPRLLKAKPPARRVDNPKRVDSLLDKSIQAWYSRHWKGKPPR